MAKNNIRSLRYDDDTAKIIEDFKGDSYMEMDRHAMQSKYADFMDSMRRFAEKADKL